MEYMQQFQIAKTFTFSWEWDTSINVTPSERAEMNHFAEVYIRGIASNYGISQGKLNYYLSDGTKKTGYWKRTVL